MFIDLRGSVQLQNSNCSSREQRSDKNGHIGNLFEMKIWTKLTDLSSREQRSDENGHIGNLFEMKIWTKWTDLSSREQRSDENGHIGNLFEMKIWTKWTDLSSRKQRSDENGRRRALSVERRVFKIGIRKCNSNSAWYIFFLRRAD